MSRYLVFSIIGFLLSPVSLVEGKVWRQTDWSGGDGQLIWSDSTRFEAESGINYSRYPGQMQLAFWRNTGQLGEPHTIYTVWGLIEADDGALYAATGPYMGDVYRSTNRGDTWVPTPDQPDSEGGQIMLTSIMQSHEGNLYVGAVIQGTFDYGAVFKSEDMGMTWERVVKLEKWVWSILETSDSVFYASAYSGSPGSPEQGHVYRSIDAGETWLETGEIVNAKDVIPLIEGLDGAIYAGVGVDPDSGPCCYGAIFKSVDQGSTWTNLGELSGTNEVRSLIQTSDSTLYAGGSSYGGPHVFKSTDWGENWQATSVFPEYMSSVLALLEASDGAIYAGTVENNGGKVYKTADQGGGWTEVGAEEGYYPFGSFVYSLAENSDSLLYAGTGFGVVGRVLRGEYAPGWLVSSVYNTENAPYYGAINWVDSLHGGTVTVKVRTDSLPSMVTAASWEACPPCSNGQNLSSLPSVSDGHRFVQYRLELSSPFPRDSTPVVHEISIEHGTNGLGEEEIPSPKPTNWSLGQNYPNPFNSVTVIPYTLHPEERGTWSGERPQCHITLKIYNVLGKEVRTIVDQRQRPGMHTVLWDGKDNHGKEVKSGIYLYQLKIGTMDQVRKFVVIR